MFRFCFVVDLVYSNSYQMLLALLGSRYATFVCCICWGVTYNAFTSFFVLMFDDVQTTAHSS